MENNIHELMNKLNDIKDKFVKRKLYLYNKLGVVQKELSNIDKFIEFNNFDSDKKENIYDHRKKLLLLRREIKEELKYFEEIDKDNQFSYNSLGYYIKVYNDSKKTIEDIAVKSANFYTSNPDSIKRISLEGMTEDEIENLIENMQSKYEKVFIDKEENSLKAYNKCRII